MKTYLETALRFGFSPLLELSISYQILQNPTWWGAQRKWAEEALRALYGVTLPMMDAIIPSRHYIADFVTPTPSAIRIDIEADLEELRATPHERIRADILYCIKAGGESEARDFFLRYPGQALERLIDELRLYWARALSHHWTRIQATLENDILYRGRQLALEGPSTLLNQLDERLQYSHADITITIQKDKPQIPRYYPVVIPVAERGLQLVPAAFGKFYWQFDEEKTPMVVYGMRGAGLWYNQNTHDPIADLEVALGTGRARVLLALTTPASVLELAHRLGITSGAVSQHLSRLNEAGLVQAHRSGKWVYYRLTARGEGLLQLFR